MRVVCGCARARVRVHVCVRVHVHVRMATHLWDTASLLVRPVAARRTRDRPPGGAGTSREESMAVVRRLNPQPSALSPQPVATAGCSPAVGGAAAVPLAHGVGRQVQGARCGAWRV